MLGSSSAKLKRCFFRIRKRAERPRIDGGDAEETTKQPVFFCYGLL
jgi:hypothetical protein